MPRLTKIYTRTGDDGTTGLGDGSRVPKGHLRIDAYGLFDDVYPRIGAVLTVEPSARCCFAAPSRSSSTKSGRLCVNLRNTWR